MFIVLYQKEKENKKKKEKEKKEKKKKKTTKKECLISAFYYLIVLVFGVVFCDISFRDQTLHSQSLGGKHWEIKAQERKRSRKVKCYTMNVRMGE